MPRRNYPPKRKRKFKQEFKPDDRLMRPREVTLSNELEKDPTNTKASQSMTIEAQITNRAHQIADRYTNKLEMEAVAKVWREHPNVALAERATTASERGELLAQVDFAAERAKALAVPGDAWEIAFQTARNEISKQLAQEEGAVARPDVASIPQGESVLHGGELRSKSERRF